MKYKITLNDSIELLVVADSEVEAVKKAKEVRSKLGDADFSKESHQGFKILAKFKEGNRMHVIVKRSNDYVVGAGYDESDGYWAQGHYNFSTYDKALKFLKEDYPNAYKISE